MKSHGRAWLAALVVTSAGCEMRSYSIYARIDAADNTQGRPDGGLVDAPDRPDAADAAPPSDGPRPDGGVCIPVAEICNGIDDNCDGVIDEGFDFFTDVKNCGRCGNLCSFGHADARCSLGKCQLGACQTGYVDTDLIAVNGCECPLQNAGVEACNGVDDDCDGLRDETFDFDRDPMNCGACNRACKFANAGATCNAGRCAMAACAAGFVDLNRAPQDGCEYACAPSNNGVEICDQLDNNCDGKTDESDPRVGTACFPAGVMGCDATSGRCNGGCALGTWACLPGGLTCGGATLPTPDVCDGLDNNCDGRTDEDFDLQNDPRWCGACNRACALPNAINGCAGGACKVAFCKVGWVDLDQGPGNGCEYQCTRDGPEVCDGKDNDCDGKTDEQDDDIRFPPKNTCIQIGECGNGPGNSSRYPGAGSFPVCVIPPGGTVPDWYCNYPDSVQLFAPNQVLGQETWCDGKDNDCDGMTDEHTNPRVGTACQDDGLGECRKTGVLRCQADRTLAPTCDVTGVPDYLPADELCDGRDSDCDGLTDEPWDNPANGPGIALKLCAGAPCLGARDDVAHVMANGANYYIYRFEASRPDATGTTVGLIETRACSRAVGGVGVLPWASVDRGHATAACAAAGMRLCRTTRTAACSSTAVGSDEWGLACNAGLICPGPTSQPYPYGCSYVAATCNGADQGLQSPAASGAYTACVTPDGISDMSGNVLEWTEDCRGTLDDGTLRKTYTLRGGSYLSIAGGLRCGFMATVVAEDFAFTDTGFRCCSSCAPGLADCGPGPCADLGSDNGNCGLCGRACQAGTTCVNGRCQ